METSSLPIRIIPKEEAVFWLDKDGYWHNRHGRFQNPKIIARFHACIRKDKHGYYLTQDHPSYREKIYFPYEDTALFAIDLRTQEDQMILVLNTGNKIPLQVENLYIARDHLYMHSGQDRIKFTERALMAISKYMQFQDRETKIVVDGHSLSIPTQEEGKRIKTD